VRQHSTESFKLSADVVFTEKLRDVPARSRTDPILPSLQPALADVFARPFRSPPCHPTRPPLSSNGPVDSLRRSAKPPSRTRVWGGQMTSVSSEAPRPAHHDGNERLIRAIETAVEFAGLVTQSPDSQQRREAASTARMLLAEAAQQLLALHLEESHRAAVSSVLQLVTQLLDQQERRQPAISLPPRS
jgi:hypothetical protein